MPGFKASSTDIALFRVTDTAVVTADKLKRHAFRPIDDLKGEESTAGWVSFDDMMDTDWLSPPERGEWLVWSLRVDKRSVPGSVISKHLAEAVKKEAAKAEDGKVSRNRRKELRELLRLKLLSRAEPVPSVADVALNAHSGLMLVGTKSGGMLEKFMECFQGSFGCVPAEIRFQESMPELLRTLYDTGLRASLDGHDFALSEAGLAVLEGADAEGEKVGITAKNDRDAVDAGLAKGFSFARLRAGMLRDNDSSLAWTMTLDSATEGVATLSGVKTPATSGDGDASPDATLLEKLYLLEQAAGVALELFEQR